MNFPKTQKWFSNLIKMLKFGIETGNTNVIFMINDIYNQLQNLNQKTYEKYKEYMNELSDILIPELVKSLKYAIKKNNVNNIHMICNIYEQFFCINKDYKKNRVKYDKYFTELVNQLEDCSQRFYLFY